jgi:hypothetical protein
LRRAGFETGDLPLVFGIKQLSRQGSSVSKSDSYFLKGYYCKVSELKGSIRGGELILIQPKIIQKFIML